MGYTVTGNVIDKDKQSVPFALVFKSDKNGVVITPSNNTTTDIDGNWKLDNLNDTDNITVRVVGLTPKTFTAKSVPLKTVGGVQKKVAQTTLMPSIGTSLGEVEVFVPKETPKELPQTEPKKPNYAIYVLIGGVALLLFGGAIALISKNKKIA